MNRQELVDEIVKREWDMFQQVNNEGGRASCQDDWHTFRIMRSAQYACWPEDLLEQMEHELRRGKTCGRNLVMEKYARMMESTAPEKFRELEPYLPVLTEENRELAEEIIAVHCRWMREHAEKYPALSARGRLLYTSQDTEWETSSETYLRGEIQTWSAELLRRYLEFVRDCEKRGVNLVIEQDRRAVIQYGYKSLEEAEKHHAGL